MSTLERDTDLATLSERELGALLEQLEREEGKASRRRSALHNRIDFLRAGGFAAEVAGDDDISSLLETERELSTHRHDLHRRIDEVRSEISRRRALR